MITQEEFDKKVIEKVTADVEKYLKWGKKQRIIITGGLGYIGSELCRIYSGESRYKDIIVIDNRFLSARVQQLSNWGIQFLHGDIRDKEFMKKALEGADICYHLASITDVAYTKKHETEEKELLITDVGINGLQNVLEYIPKECKLLFPSSHTVYDGLQTTMFGVTEEDTPQPALMYSGMKVESERIIRGNTDNYIIVRLASVYGLSEDNMRINIMPNLFSKITSQDGIISLFSGGVQFKSLANVVDVARAMKHLIESTHTGTYHISNENVTIKEVAQICKEVNPKVTLIETDDEIPNLGYTLSNKKLLGTGFKFLYNIKDSIREMVTSWSYKNTSTPDEYIIRGGKEYRDQRGIISNYELPEPINLIGYIESIKGSVRANHYHPIQEQKCLLLMGRYVSVTKDLSYPDTPVEYKIIRAGDIAVIRPNVAHTMVFLQDSVFLNLVRGEREHENYGITHTISYQLVDEQLRDTIMSTYTHCCRACKGTHLKPVIDLGMSPLANNLLDSKDQHIEMFPLEVEYCPKCHNCQLSTVVPAEKMFDNYLYVSSTSQVFRKHFEDAADQYIKEFNLTSESLVLDIGSNDGVFLRPLQQRGIRVVGIEPAKNICKMTYESGIPTIEGYFNQQSAQVVYDQYGSPDIITASNVFAHADDLIGIIQTVFSLLKEKGVFIIEVQYLVDTMRDLTFDNIYHEHVNYWSVTSLNNFFNRLGYSMFHVEHIDTHGGSIRCYIDRDSADDGSVEQYLTKEEQKGIKDYGTYIQFRNQVEHLKKTVQENIQLLKAKYQSICAYGSPAKATTALNYFGITGKDIMYTIEDNTLKVGKYIPGVDIPIVDHTYGPNTPPDICIVLAWNFFDPIVKSHQYMVDRGTQFISIKDIEIPEMPVLDTKVTELVGSPITGKVYDCFMFFNELDTLEMRLNIHDPLVDYFVICEAAVTHSGIKREPLFEKNKERYSKFLHKIKYILLDTIPDNFTELPTVEEYTDRDKAHNKIIGWYNSSDYVDKNNLGHCREWYQRDSMIKELVGCNDDDVILMSELDEICNPDTLQGILNNFDPTRIYGTRQNSYYYYINLLKEKHWVGCRVASYKKFCEYRTSTFRHFRDIIVANGGWHFSYQGSIDQIKQKMLSYCHYVEEDSVAIQELQDNVNTFTDPFGRDGKLKRFEIDSSFPQYILDNIDRYKHMII